METIKDCFTNFGFQPIETPSFERSETLLGKYGEEGDRLIFKILNSGDYLKRADETVLAEKNSNKLTGQISEKALRYDLTVPFARYVVQNRNDITFPFKRYQIQPVWRADRPQKGRFREFYQCDADVVGSNSLWQEIELIQLYDTVFTKLNLGGTTIKINNRRVLNGIAEVIGAEDKLVDFTVALDKLDKIGQDGVIAEMLEKGISQKSIDLAAPLFDSSSDTSVQLSKLDKFLKESPVGMRGMEELRFVMGAIEELGLRSAKVEVDITLARGLNYYTGTIFEVAAPEEVEMGSIGGGGRYDDLTGIFGLKDMSGVGISFGLDRIYLVMEELDVFPESVSETTRVLFINFSDPEAIYAMKAIEKMRDAGISSELYPDAVKMGKQMAYADKRGIPYVILAGENEMENKTYTIKNMETGEQSTLSIEQLLARL